MLTGVSFCSGIGGLDLAAESAGIRILAQVEYDAACQRVLRAHWPQTTLYGDMKELTGDEPELCAAVLWFGGIPCQPYSVAGKMRAEHDERDLWPDFFRLIRRGRPRWVVIENVANFARLALDRVCADLEGEGYAVGAQVLPACASGAPHQRERCFTVAFDRQGSLADAGGPGRQQIARGPHGDEAADAGWPAPHDHQPQRADEGPRGERALADAAPGGQPREPWLVDGAALVGAGAGAGGGDRRGDCAAGAGGGDPDAGYLYTLANANRGQREGRPGPDGGRDALPEPQSGRDPGGRGGALADADGGGRGATVGHLHAGQPDPEGRGGGGTDGRRPGRPLADADGARLERYDPAAEGLSGPLAGGGARYRGRTDRAAFAPLPALADAADGGFRCGEPPRQAGLAARGGEADEGAGLPEPLLGGAAARIAARMDGVCRFPAAPGKAQHAWEVRRVTHEKLPGRAERLKQLGNAVVWTQAAPAFLLIAEWERVYGPCGASSVAPSVARARNAHPS